MERRMHLSLQKPWSPSSGKYGFMTHSVSGALVGKQGMTHMQS